MAFLLIAIVGFFGYGENTEASHCHTVQGTLTCNPDNGGAHNPDGTPQINSQSETGVLLPQTTPEQNALEEQAVKSCGVIMKGSLGGCLVALFYYVFIGLVSSLLGLGALFFDFMLTITLNSNMYGDFIGKAWIIVRDLSNVFFILVLIYVGVKTIIGLGGHDTKKMIGSVVVMALLINFSMFFTKIVIDSSNILALIFYNKINVEVKDGRGVPQDINYAPIIDPTKGTSDKDVAGALVSKFNPGKMIDADFFKKYEKTKMMFAPSPSNLIPAAGVAAGAYYGTAAIAGIAGIFGLTVALPVTAIVTVAGGLAYLSSSVTTEVPVPLMLSVITLCGSVMLFALYAFVVSGLSFLGRLIELWILIIFSPFAFMSFAIPQLAHFEYIGWDAWLKRLFTVSFMAPIFMFLLYLISLIVEADPIGYMAKRSVADQHWMEFLILLIVPSAMILIMLLKAAEFAKKGSGAFGEVVISGAKVLGGLALGGAALGTAAVGRKVIGGAAASFSNREKAMSHGETLFQDSKKLEAWEHGTKKWKEDTEKWRKGGSRGAPPVRTTPLTPPTPTTRPTDLNYRDRIGARINAAQLKAGHISHAQHEMDKLKEKTGVKGIGNLSGIDEKRLKEEFTDSNRGEIEQGLRRGVNKEGKMYDLLGDETTNKDDAVSEAGWTKDNRARVNQDVIRANAAGDVAGGQLTDQGRKNAEERLKVEFGNLLKDLTKTITETKFAHLKEESQQKLGLVEKLTATSTSGSYDIRDAGNMGDKRDGLSAKATFGIIAAIATGMRMGLKQGAGVDSGTPQRDVFKDMGEVITKSFKGANFNLDFKSGGGDSHAAKNSHDTSGGGHH